MDIYKKIEDIEALDLDVKGRRAVILMSGGIDSSTTAAEAIKLGYELFPITFSYSQKHSTEIEFAKRMLEYLRIKNHLIVDIPSIIFSSSALSAKSEIEIPKNRNLRSMNDIPVTYVPGRNILFLSYATAYAESIGSRDIFIGANSIDYSGYPDCRYEFLQAYEDLVNIGTRSGVMGDRFTIHAPLLFLKKSEIIRLGVGLGIDFSITHSCYNPIQDDISCGECDSCLIRKNGFLEAGLVDPIKYISR